MAEKSIYSVHPSVAYSQAIIQNLLQKTGKSIDEWIKCLNETNLDDEKARRHYLKNEFKLGGTTANLIAQVSVGKAADSTDPETYLASAAGWVEHMYSGKKADLRPIYDALIKLGRALSNDIKICPCKTIVPLYRKHVFAEIKPATQKRVDLGLALKKYTDELSVNLIDTGGLQKGDRITHRFALSQVDDITEEVKKWLQIAYDLDA